MAWPACTALFEVVDNGSNNSIVLCIGGLCFPYIIWQVCYLWLWCGILNCTVEWVRWVSVLSCQGLCVHHYLYPKGVVVDQVCMPDSVYVHFHWYHTLMGSQWGMCWWSGCWWRESCWGPRYWWCCQVDGIVWVRIRMMVDVFLMHLMCSSMLYGHLPIKCYY